MPSPFLRMPFYKVVGVCLMMLGSVAACDSSVEPQLKVDVETSWSGEEDTYTEVYNRSNTYEADLEVSVENANLREVTVENEETGYEQTFNETGSHMAVAIEDDLEGVELEQGQSVLSEYEIEVNHDEGLESKVEHVEVFNPALHNMQIEAKTLLQREPNPHAEVYFRWRDIDTTFVADNQGRIDVYVPEGESELGLYGMRGDAAETALDRLKVRKDFYPDEEIFTWYDTDGNPLDHAWHVNAPVWGEDLSETEQLELSHALLDVDNDFTTQMETLSRIEDYHRVRNLNQTDEQWVGFNPYKEMRHILYEGNPSCGHMEGVPGDRIWGETPDSLWSGITEGSCDDEGEKIPGTVVGERQIQGFENYEEAVQEAVSLHGETPWVQRFDVMDHDEIVEEYPEISWGESLVRSGFAENVALYQAHGTLSGREWNGFDDHRNPEVMTTAHVLANFSILGTWFSLESRFPGVTAEDKSGVNCTIRYDEAFEVPSATMNRCGWSDITDLFPVMNVDKYIEEDFDPVMYHKDDWQKGSKEFGNSYAIQSVISPTINQKLVNGERGYNMDTLYHGDEGIVDESLRK